MAMINHALPKPVDGYVDVRFLTDFQTEAPGLMRAQAVAVSTYAGDTPTLMVLITEPGPAEGAVFSYLPFDAFSTSPLGPILPFRDLVYHDCREGSLDVSVIDTLPSDLWAYLKPKDAWYAGRYVLTLDWPDANDLLHLVLLNAGQFAALPNHKIKFGAFAPRSFPKFRKLHSTWKVAV